MRRHGSRALPGPLCGVVARARMSEVLADVARASRLADLIEVRLDHLRGGDLGPLLRPSRRPLLLTVRSRDDGGAFEGTEPARRALLARLLRDSPHFVDAEASLGPRALAPLVATGRVLVSHHDDERTPEDLPGVLRVLRRIAGGAPVKLVTRANDMADAVRIRANLLRAGSGVTMFAMGEAGVVTRTMAVAWGSALSYGAVAEAHRTAAGQPTLADLATSIDRLSRGARLFGIAGDPIDHSLSPLLHNVILTGLAVDAAYVPVPGADLAGALRAFRALGGRGVSVTAPHKEAAMRLARRGSELARRVGAANTLLWNSGWEAENTDVAGVVEGLGRARRWRDRTVVVIGTGGAARACAVALGDAGARIVICGRDAGRAAALAALVPGSRSCPLGAAAAVPAALWINATSAAGSPVPARFWRHARPGALAFDLSYARPSPFLQAAACAGLAVIDGLPMLFRQGLLQARLFTGMEIPAPLARRGWRALKTAAALSRIVPRVE